MHIRFDHENCSFFPNYKLEFINSFKTREFCQLEMVKTSMSVHDWYLTRLLYAEFEKNSSINNFIVRSFFKIALSIKWTSDAIERCCQSSDKVTVWTHPKFLG